MSIPFRDRLLESCNAPGAGPVSLLGAEPGPWQSFDVIGDGNWVYYAIADQAGTNWEVGRGIFTLSGRTLTRFAGSVIDGTHGPKTLVNFSSGTQDVLGVLPSNVINFMFAVSAMQVGGL
jgi:hypothetical protein